MNKIARRVCLIIPVLALGICGNGNAAEPPTSGPAAATKAAPMVVNFNITDVSGNQVKVPVDRPSVLAFVRTDQDQSKDALKQIRSDISDAKTAQVVVIVSGPMANEQAKQLSTDQANGWPVAADPDFALAGKLGVHVWPTTLVIKPDGTQAAHLAGMPQTFSTDLQAYLDFASGKLDQAALQQKLTRQDVITDSPAQAASRHLEVAQRLIEQSQIEQAKSELNEGLKYVPNDPMLQLALGKVQVLLGDPKGALETVAKVPAGTVPAWQVNLIRGQALVAMEKWADAKAVLPDALTLNPQPAEAHYLLGLCYQHDQDWPHAAEQFRLAYEKSAARK